MEAEESYSNVNMSDYSEDFEEDEEPETNVAAKLPASLLVQEVTPTVQSTAVGGEKTVDAKSHPPRKQIRGRGE